MAMDAEIFINELVAAIEAELMGPNGDALLAGLGVIAGLFTGIIVFAVVTALIRMICRWRIFSKAGEKGWKSIIPFYNTYTEFAVTWSGLQGILMMLAMMIGNYILFASEPETLVHTIGSLLGIYSSALSLIQVHKLSRSFGHKFGFTLGLIFLNPIFMLILAFGKNSQYVGPAVKSK